MTGYQTGTRNRLLSDGAFDYTYDNEGNMLTKTEIATGKVTEYTWDYRNRLTSVKTKDSQGAVIRQTEYVYDPLDKRIAVSDDPDGDGQEPATERWTVYDGSNPYADFDDSGNLTTRYLYGPAVDMILARESAAGDVAWYLTDHVGTVRDIADPDGAVIDHIVYNSFGGILSESSPSSGDRFKYTGRELDPNGLYNYRARYYDAALGRFLSEDPIAFAANDANLYRYVGNAPTARTD
jgi:RHS repeat-associated protein